MFVDMLAVVIVEVIREQPEWLVDNLLCGLGGLILMRGVLGELVMTSRVRFVDCYLLHRERSLELNA